MARATTVRFTDEMFARLDQASARIGMPVNSIVIAACLEWMQRHTPETSTSPETIPLKVVPAIHPPRWSTIRRAVELAAGMRGHPMYPFERFTDAAEKLLTTAQAEAKAAGFTYIGTEHLVLAAYSDPTSQAATVLATLGIGERDVRDRLDQLTGHGQRTNGPKLVPTSRVKAVIELAFKLCSAAGDPRVSTGHIVLALATEGEGLAARVLRDLGATRERIEAALGELSEAES